VRARAREVDRLGLVRVEPLDALRGERLLERLGKRGREVPVNRGTLRQPLDVRELDRAAATSVGAVDPVAVGGVGRVFAIPPALPAPGRQRREDRLVLRERLGRGSAAGGTGRRVEE
jgi:hypothetical protein